MIEAVWVFEVPMALPLDARIPDEDLKRARKALQRAKAVGEEYEGVEVATATVRARSAGEGIVREAKRRGVEAIVLAAEEPTRMRGGPLLGGKRGLYDTFVGQTTRYVVNKAPCRVILTAPPGDGAAPALPHHITRVRPAAHRRPGRGRPRQRRHLRCGRGGADAPLVRVRASVRPRRRIRQGRIVRGHRRAARGPHRVRARRGPALARAARRRARPGLGGGRRALHDRDGAGDGRADRGGDRGGGRVHRLHERRQHQPRGLPDRPAPVRGRSG